MSAYIRALKLYDVKMRCLTVKHAIGENKTQTFSKQITDSNGDQKKLFNIINTLLCRQKHNN